MASFNTQSTILLAVGAVILGTGIYFQAYSAARLQEAQTALQNVQSSVSQAEVTRHRAKQYVGLIANMQDNKIDRQEPLALTSNFSPTEISQIGQLLDNLYQHGGYFFLKKFDLAWKGADPKAGLLPRVVLNLEGRKVLMFSKESVGVTPDTAVTH